MPEGCDDVSISGVLYHGTAHDLGEGLGKNSAFSGRLPEGAFLTSDYETAEWYAWRSHETREDSSDEYEPDADDYGPTVYAVHVDMDNVADCTDGVDLDIYENYGNELRNEYDYQMKAVFDRVKRAEFEGYDGAIIPSTLPRARTEDLDFHPEVIVFHPDRNAKIIEAINIFEPADFGRLKKLGEEFTRHGPPKPGPKKRPPVLTASDYRRRGLRRGRGGHEFGGGR